MQPDGLDALRGREVTAEEIRQAIGETSHPNGMGGTIKGLSAAGRLRFVGYRKATRKAARGHLLRIWLVS